MARASALLFISLVAAIALFALPLQHARAADTIEWRLENPFRLFKNPKHTELHEEIYRRLSAGERRAPVLTAERKLAEKFGSRGWAETMFNQTCYDQDADRYTACADYILPKSHRIQAKLSANRNFWDLFQLSGASGVCQWRLESRAGEMLARKTSNCDAQTAFDVPYPQGARLMVKPEGGFSEIVADIKIRDVLIVGMGDSFGAGEGNPDHPVRFNDSRTHDYGKIELAASGDKKSLDGYPARSGDWTKFSNAAFQKERARWWDRECHRSLYSHQLRAALQLALEDPKRAVTFLSFSCSGAEIAQGILLNMPVRECTAGEQFSVPGQISALSRELCGSEIRTAPMPAAIIQRMPELRGIAESEMQIMRCKTESGGGRTKPALKRPIDLIFLSVGGNDVGFVPLVADSILSGASIYRTLGQQMNSVYGVERARKRMDLLKKRLDGMKFALELLLDAGNGGKVIMTGYPNLGYAADGVSACSGSKGMEVFPPFQLDAAKVGKAEEFSTELNRALASFSERDWTFVDGFRDDFRAHGLCASNGGDPAETLGFPRYKDGAWTPYAPSLYPSYASRQRWFRTPNDAFMSSHTHAGAISNFGANCSRLFTGALKTIARRHWPPFQLFLASTYGGAFHPTAEGQARIADEVVKSARAALGGGS